MDALLFSLNTVFPLLVMMAAGFIARSLKWLSEDAVRQINACVFRVFLPLLLCFNIADSTRETVPDAFTLVFAFATTLFCFLLLFWVVPRLVKRRESRGVMIQGIVRSNYAIFGIPLVQMMYPGCDTSIAVMMVAVIVPVFNIMATVALMTYGTVQRRSVLGLIRGIALNPLIIGTLIGLVMWLTQFKLPMLIEAPLRKLSGVATPLALFLLGASLDFAKARANVKLLAISVLGRLVLVPAAFLSLAIALGIRDVSLATLIAVYASPTSVSSFPMAQQMGGDSDLAGAQVVFTTILSILTVFLWVFALKLLGFLA